jgi:hypothetical protein
MLNLQSDISDEMQPKNRSQKTSRKSRKLQRDRIGDLYADIADESGQSRVRISFKRNWYSPPFEEDGTVDLQQAVDELSDELTGGTLVLARYLESGELGYRTELPVASKDELEYIIRTMRKLYVDGLRHDNAVRQAALDAYRSKVVEVEKSPAEPRHTFTDRRRERDRRTRERRGRQLLGRLWFRKEDRRMEEDRRNGKDRRAA